MGVCPFYTRLYPLQHLELRYGNQYVLQLRKLEVAVLFSPILFDIAGSLNAF
jgi:hypothetical protein